MSKSTRSSALLLGLLCAAILTALPASSVSLDRDVGTPKSYSWDSAKTWAKDPLLNPIFNIFKTYKIPSAAIGYQLNPDPTKIAYNPPTKWRPSQVWWMAGFGVNYKSPMRVASVSKSITDAVYAQYLSAYYGSTFWSLWTKHVGGLPTPKDPRVKLITIRHLLDHKSGFDNGKIGFDPAFAGKAVTSQISGIISTKYLLAAPGKTYSYSNFGYMILAQLAEGITRKSYITLARSLFPVGAPVYAAHDTSPVPASGLAGAAEPSIYYVQKPDTQFDVKPMKGNGNIVSNVATLSWFGTQYWIGGTNNGKKFSAVSPKGKNFAWIWNGSMPGTMAFLVQWITPKGQVAAISININTRVKRPTNNAFFKAVNDASLTFLKNKFAKY